MSFTSVYNFGESTKSCTTYFVICLEPKHVINLNLNVFFLVKKIKIKSTINFKNGYCMENKPVILLLLQNTSLQHESYDVYPWQNVFIDCTSI